MSTKKVNQNLVSQREENKEMDFAESFKSNIKHRTNLSPFVASSSKKGQKPTVKK